MNEIRKRVRWVFAVLAIIVAGVALLSLTIPAHRPDEARARHDFLAEHPTFTVDRVAFEEHEVGFVAYRIFYRKPDSATRHSEVASYLHTDEGWRIMRKTRSR